MAMVRLHDSWSTSIRAQVPISVSGYGVPGEEGTAVEAGTRTYRIGDHVIAVVTVLNFEDRPGVSPAGFLFDGKLYKEISSVDLAVAEMATEMLLARWGRPLAEVSLEMSPAETGYIEWPRVRGSADNGKCKK